MGPGIKRSIGEGFRAANRSWKGIAFYVGGLLVVTGVTIGGLLVSNPPPEAFQVQPEAFQAQPSAFSIQEEAATEIAGEGLVPTSEDQEAALFGEELNAVLTDEEQEQVRIVSEWFGRAWFLILLTLLVAMAGNLWLSGGQIGYLAKQVTTQRAPVSEFWVVGTRAFLPLLGAAGLGILGIGAVALITVLLGALVALLPGALGGVLGVLLAVVSGAGLVWLIVRLAFWFVAIVVDRLGPIAALKTSFRSTRKRWWRVFGLGALLVLISYAAQLPFGLLDWFGGIIGGGMATVIGVVSAIVGMLVSLYVGFITLGAYIRFYEDTKTAPAASPAGSVNQ